MREQSGEWCAWFKIQHESSSRAKVPKQFDVTAWQVENTNLVRKMRAEPEASGRTVFTENQNSFVLRRATAALGGKPDLIAMSSNEGLIINAKTGTVFSPGNTHTNSLLASGQCVVGFSGGGRYGAINCNCAYHPPVKNVP